MKMSIDNMSTDNIQKYLDERKEKETIQRGLFTSDTGGWIIADENLEEVMVYEDKNIRIRVTDSEGTTIIFKNKSLLCKLDSLFNTEDYNECHSDNDVDDDECNICDDSCDFKCGGW